MKTNAIGMRECKSQEKSTTYAKYTMRNERKMTIIITALVSFRSGFFGVRIQDASTLFKLYKMIVVLRTVSHMVCLAVALWAPPL